MLLAYSKICSIADTISQDTQDGDISLIEFQKVLSNNNAKNKATTKVIQITRKKKQLEELLEKGKKGRQKKFFTKNC